MRVRVLGPLEVDEGRTGLGPRDRVVLEALAARSGNAVPAECLAEALWGEQVPPTWLKVVQGCVVRLRKALGAEAIQTSTDGYQLSLHSDQIDHRKFDHLVGRARDLLANAEPERAAFIARQALDLWRGRPFAELDEWPEGQLVTHRLDELHLEAQELLVEAELRSGHPAAVVPEARRLVDERPAREHRWSLLAQAEYGAGRPAEALATLHRARHTLGRELGLDPGPELVALEQSILRHDTSLAVEIPGKARAACPYPGLLAYDVEDADAYFGRESDIEACLQRLDSVGLLAVVGPSGCGKSSLARAGIAAALCREGREVVVFSPGIHPVVTVAETWIPASAALVVDQCEELFHKSVDERERVTFLDALLEHAERAPVVITLRADRVGELAGYPVFARRVEPGMYLLAAMSAVDLRRSIEGPAAQAGLRLEPGLVDLLVREVEGEPGALPLLSHALRTTWERREGPTLTVAAYQQSGGIRESVAQSAEQVVNALPPHEQDALRELMLRLVVLNDDGDAVRAHLSRRNLPPLAQGSDLVERLVAARLIAADDDGLQVAHEALVHAWPRLRTWMDDDVEGLRTRRHLAVAAESWDQLGRPESELYRGGRLERAREWVRRAAPTLTEGEQVFLQASTAQAEAAQRALDEQLRRERRLNRRLYSGLAAVAVLLAVAVFAGAAARTAASRADRQATAADARRLGAEALGAPQLDRALLLAAAGLTLDDSVDVRNHLLETLARAPALAGTARTSGPIFDLAANPSTGDLAVAVSNGPVELYDGATMRRLAVSARPGGTGIAASPDGQLYAVSVQPDLVATGKGEPVLLLGPTLQRSPVQLGQQPAGYYTWSCSFSPNGRWLAASMIDLKRERPVVIGIWDLRSPSHPLAVLEPRASASPTVSDDGRTLYTLDDGGLLVTALPSGAMRRYVDKDALRVRQLGEALAQSPDGRRLAIGAGVEAVVLDTRTYRPEAYLPGGQSIADLAFSADGHRIAATGEGLRVWDLGGREPSEILRQNTPTDAPAFSPDGQTVYTTRFDATQAWDLSGAKRFLVREPGEALGWDAPEVRVSPDGSRIAYAMPDPPRFRIRDAATGALDNEVTATGMEQGPFIDIAWHPDGTLLTITSGAPEVRLWDAETGDEVARHPLGSSGDTGGASVAVFSVDGKYLLVGTTTGRLHVLNARSLVPTRDPIQVYPHTDPSGPKIIASITPSTGDRAYIGGLVVHYRTGAKTPQVDLGYPEPTVVPFPDGQRLMVDAGDAGIGLFDLTNNTWISPPNATQAGLMGRMTAFSSDGSLFASASDDNRLSYWDARTGGYLGSAPVDVNGAPAFSADGRLFLAGYEGSVFSWNLDPRFWLVTACRLAGRGITEDEWRSYLGDRPYQPVCGV
jgi:WD40 repeat protein/DNA-binding SARP family transcriptional activator